MRIYTLIWSLCLCIVSIFCVIVDAAEIFQDNIANIEHGIKTPGY